MSVREVERQLAALRQNLCALSSNGVTVALEGYPNDRVRLDVVAGKLQDPNQINQPTPPSMNHGLG